MAKILIADDELMVRDVLTEIFFRLGHEVTPAVNGYEALRLFAENSIDLVTTDFNMPVMDGLILAKRIKQKSPGTPVILITGKSVEVEGRKNKGEYVDLILFKPFGLEDLKNAIEELLAFNASNSNTGMMKMKGLWA